jgi:ATP-dependent Clp protease ATP-binding subunit ClpA
MIKKIVTLRIDALKTRMMEKGITLEVSDAALEYLAKEGYNPHYGARPLNRLIQSKILNQVASFMIAGTTGDGDVVTVDEKKGDLVIEGKRKTTRPRASAKKEKMEMSR